MAICPAQDGLPGTPGTRWEAYQIWKGRLIPRLAELKAKYNNSFIHQEHNCYAEPISSWWKCSMFPGAPKP